MLKCFFLFLFIHTNFLLDSFERAKLFLIFQKNFKSTEIKSSWNRHTCVQFNINQDFFSILCQKFCDVQSFTLLKKIEILKCYNIYFTFFLKFSAASASNNDTQLYCQTGLEDRPPPPSLHQHYNSYYHIASTSSRSDIDPGDDTRDSSRLVQPPQQATVNMCPT